MVQKAALFFMSELVTRAVSEVMGAMTPPDHLHHYTSLEVIEKIVPSDNVRLSHAEYSNDRDEIITARSTIAHEIFRSQNPMQLIDDFHNAAAEIDNYVFCTSANDQPDQLSQWRGYGNDGRGGCIYLDRNRLAQTLRGVIGLRIAPVIYDDHAQRRIVRVILGSLGQPNGHGGAYSIADVLGALLLLLPLMKHKGFSEEKEWRIIFTPSEDDPITVYFHPRRDFLAPYVWLQDICSKRPAEIIEEINETLGGRAHILPITGIMVGPSGNIELNLRSMTKIIAASRPGIMSNIEASEIPYRSLA